jgi:RNA polymerase sigma factor (sigma-70 family)
MYEPTQKEMDYLLRQARFLAERISFRYAKDFDDLVSAAQLGITHACRAWRGVVGQASFTTYAKIRMIGEMKEDLRSNTYFKGRRNHTTPLHGLDLDQLASPGDPFEAIENAEFRDQITRYVETSSVFTARERDLYRLLYLEGLKQNTIAAMWDRTQSCVSLHKKTLHRKLKAWALDFYGADDRP